MTRTPFRIGAAVTALTLLTATPAVTEPFPREQILRPYESDNSSDGMFYFSVVAPFEDLQANHPEVLDQSLEKVIEVNNTVADDRAAQLRALDDAHDDPPYLMSDALGATVGQHFRDAWDEGKLQKTQQLLSGNLARAGGVASSTFAEKYYYDYERPYNAAPDRVNHYEREAEDTRPTSPSFPSGHTNKAAWTSSLMALMIPEAGPQIQARASEAGHNRMVLGVHYPLDIIGGRMTGNAAAADRWADLEFRALIEAAAEEVRGEIESRCGATVEVCVANDSPYLSTSEAVDVYTERMTYGFDPIAATGEPVTVPERYAGLLATTFPELTDEQRTQILAHTAIDSGYPMDGPGGHHRMNLARAMAAQVTVNADGSLSITG
ncbi:phosphatase PAP2 family protein [Corynebacterium sputi]|uniref:phosphatase PAP2 family protein n=1 Tax=Corynebacterium sputi TaxID=489915 RepID=UPI0003F8F5EB|nr:phosphatase PAP2 family protein [Corynebacterium sputi]